MTDTPSYYPTRDPQKTVAELKAIIGEKFAGDKEWLELLLEHAEQNEKITENTPIALRELIAECQPQKELTQAPERQQLDMFASAGRVDDLPLFSGTPQRVDASHFDPPTVSNAKQTKLF